MNNEKIAKYVQNIFHLENMTADDDSYNRGSISSNSWGDGITIKWVIRDFGDGKEVNLRYVYSMGSYTISIGSGMTSREASKEIVELIGRVLITQADTVDPNTGMNNILSWPYNCNLVYVEYLIEALQYGDNEITSSMQGQEKGIQAIMDEYGCSREEAIDIMNSEVTSGCHGKAKKNKKEIKSGLMLDESSERFEEFANDLCDAVIDITREKMAEYGADKNDAISALERIEPSDPDGYMSFLDSSCHGKAKKNKKESSDTEIESSIERNTNNLNKIFG